MARDPAASSQSPDAGGPDSGGGVGGRPLSQAAEPSAPLTAELLAEGRTIASLAGVRGAEPPTTPTDSPSSPAAAAKRSRSRGGGGDRSSLTPAGYHRGQNPIDGDVVGELGSGLSSIPPEILDLILHADTPGQVVHDEIGFDHITLTSKEDAHDAACHILADHGFIIAPRDAGLKWYRKALDIEGGGVVGWDYRGAGQSSIVELPGEQWMRDHERCRLAAFELTRSLEMRCTRLDIRRDQYGQGLQLIDHIGEACRAGQLRRVKQFRPMDERLARVPTMHLARGWYLGSTKSERFMRVYDKGLERGLNMQALWERCEAEIRKALADASWRSIVEAGEDWVPAAFDHLVGVVDFRIEAIRHSKLVELDRPEWWAAFCEGRDGVRPSMQREPTDAAAYLRWVGRCVMPTIEAVRERAGLESLADVWRILERVFKGVQPGGSELVVQELSQRCVEALRSVAAARDRAWRRDVCEQIPVLPLTDAGRRCYHAIIFSQWRPNEWVIADSRRAARNPWVDRH